MEVGLITCDRCELHLLEKEARKRPSRWLWTTPWISMAALLRPAHMSTSRKSYFKKYSMMETPRHRDDRLHRLRLDRKLVTGALCHVTANPLTRCHLVILLTTVVSVPSPNTVMHFEYPDPPVLPSNYSRRFEDEKTHTQKSQVREDK